MWKRYTLLHMWHYINTLQYKILVQDGTSEQGEEISILDKHAGTNKIVPCRLYFLSKRG